MKIYHKKRKPLSKWKNLWVMIRGFLINMRSCNRNARAAYSSRYILEDLNNEFGVNKLSELTGLPEGVIQAALDDICPSIELK